MNAIQTLTEEERQRYARHLNLPGFGEEAQMKLKAGSILVVGAGGLGSPVCMYLAAAGVGHIGVADGDTVDISNLQRQIIHTTSGIGSPKALSAAESMRALNPDITVTSLPDMLTADNISTVIADYDFVVDATDSFKAKFLINDACVSAGKPYSHGAIWRYEGQTMTVVPGSACYRCLFDSEPDTSTAMGPLGATAGLLGTIQAAEAIKYLTATGELLTNRLLRFNVATMQFSTITLAPSPYCLHHHAED